MTQRTSAMPRRLLPAAAALIAALAAGAALADQAGQPEQDERRRTSAEISVPPRPAGERGKVILAWDHLEDSNDREFEDFWAFVAYRQFHVQVWSGEFTDGVEVGGYLRDHRKSTYAGLYRFRDDFDHVLQFDTEQVLARGWVYTAMLRGLRITDFEDKEAAAALDGERIGDENQLQFGSGFDWYWGDYNFLSFRGVSDPREGGRWTFITSHRFHHGEPVYVQPGFIIRTDRSTGWFVQGKIKYFRWLVGDFDRFDWSDVDRTVYSAGVEIPF